MSRNAASWVTRSGLWTTFPSSCSLLLGGPAAWRRTGASVGRGCFFQRCFPCCPSTKRELRTVREVALLQQSAADLLVGSQENETAHTDEGDPRYAACKQTAEKEGKESKVYLEVEKSAHFQVLLHYSHLNRSRAFSLQTVAQRQSAINIFLSWAEHILIIKHSNCIHLCVLHSCRLWYDPGHEWDIKSVLLDYFNLMQS